MGDSDKLLVSWNMQSSSSGNDNTLKLKIVESKLETRLRLTQSSKDIQSAYQVKL